MPYALLTDRDEPDAIYAGLHNGELWHGAQRGERWRLLGRLPGIHRALVMV